MKNKKLITNIIKYIAISGLLLAYIVPFVFVLINSFKARKDVIANPLALPSTFKFSNYADAFEKMNYGHAFVNTLIITVLSVLIIIIFSSMTAYILVRKNWKFNKFIFFAMVLSMIIPFQGIMIFQQQLEIKQMLLPVQHHIVVIRTLYYKHALISFQ